MALRHRWFILIQVALLLLAAAAVVRLFTKQGQAFFDFHCFWYGGNHIWQGTDPYRAFLEKKQVLLPVDYLDGIRIEGGPIDPFCRRCVPGNTAPVVFLLSPLARFSWHTASSIWFAINILLSIAIGWILLKILGHPLRSRESILLVSITILQVSTREVLELGQTSLLIASCMFASMYLSWHNRTRAKAIISGLLLGLAVSKPLLAFPLVLLLVYRRQAVEVLTAAAVQIAGMWGITLLGTTWPGVVSEYIRVFMMHAGPGKQDGIYLTAGLLKPWMPYSYAIVAAGSLALGFILLRWHIGLKTRNIDAKTDLVLLTVVMLWNLLVFYHRRYDYVASGSFLAFMVFLSAHPEYPVLRSARERLVAFAIAGVAVVYWMVPAYQVMSDIIYRSLFDLCAIAALGLSVWILFRIREPLTGADGR